MNKYSFKTLLAAFLFLIIPYSTFAQVTTIDNVNIETLQLQNDTYRLHITFDLPKIPASAHIDYATLSFGLHIAQKSENQTMVFEILAKENTANEKVSSYNANPVSATLSRTKEGTTLLDLDITQLVRLWTKEGVKNNGIVLVSHRNIPMKFLNTNTISLAPAFKSPSVKLFYTVRE